MLVTQRVHPANNTDTEAQMASITFSQHLRAVAQQLKLPEPPLPPEPPVEDPVEVIDPDEAVDQLMQLVRPFHKAVHTAAERNQALARMDRLAAAAGSQRIAPLVLRSRCTIWALALQRQWVSDTDITDDLLEQVGKGQSTTATVVRNLSSAGVTALTADALTTWALDRQIVVDTIPQLWFSLAADQRLSSDVAVRFMRQAVLTGYQPGKGFLIPRLIRAADVSNWLRRGESFAMIALPMCDKVSDAMVIRALDLADQHQRPWLLSWLIKRANDHATTRLLDVVQREARALVNDADSRSWRTCEDLVHTLMRHRHLSKKLLLELAPAIDLITYIRGSFSVNQPEPGVVLTLLRRVSDDPLNINYVISLVMEAKETGVPVDKLARLLCDAAGSASWALHTMQASLTATENGWRRVAEAHQKTDLAMRCITAVLGSDPRLWEAWVRPSAVFANHRHSLNTAVDILRQRWSQAEARRASAAS